MLKAEMYKENMKGDAHKAALKEALKLVQELIAKDSLDEEPKKKSMPMETDILDLDSAIERSDENENIENEKNWRDQKFKDELSEGMLVDAEDSFKKFMRPKKMFPAVKSKTIIMSASPSKMK